MKYPISTLKDFLNAPKGTSLLDVHPSVIGKTDINTKTNWFVLKANIKYNNKFNYNKVKYTNWNTKVEIVCPEHGSFFQTPNNHLHATTKYECPSCANLETTKLSKIKKSPTKDQLILSFEKTHGDKYDYSKVHYVNKNTKIEIICPNHNSFWQSPSDHKRFGCPKCNSSKGETLIRNWLLSNNISFIEQYNFNKHPDLRRTKYSSYLRFDFYLPKYNLCIEYDGEQHFSFHPKWKLSQDSTDLYAVQLKDNTKNFFCLRNNTRLTRIPHWVKLTEDLVLQIINENSTIVSIITNDK